MKHQPIFLHFLFLLTTLNLLAQNPMDELSKDDLLENKNENEVKVVSASRSSRKLSELPITVEVITKEEIRRNGYITLADVLKHVQGIKVSQPGNGREGEMFLMRGLIGNYYTKILLNSIPLQPSATGALPIVEQLPIAQAERIEIIFGPASSIYGADAMAGVVNIITQNENEYNYASGTVTSDNVGFRHANFIVGGKFGKDKNVIKYDIYANYSERPDLNTHSDSALYTPLNSISFFPFREQASTDAEGFAEGFLAFLKSQYPLYSGTAFHPIIGKRPQESYLFGLQLNYRNWGFSYNEMYRQNHASTGILPFIFAYDNPNSFIGDRIQRFTLSYQKDWQRISLTSNLSYNRYRMNPNSFRATNHGGFNGTSYKYAASDDIFGEVLLRYTSKRKWEWTLGLSGQLSGILPLTNDLERPFDESVYKAFSTKPLPPHKLYDNFGLNPLLHYNIGGFAQVIKSKRKWTYIVGLRIDNNSAYESISGVESLPAAQIRISTQYRPKEHLSFRLSIGSAVKAPSPSDAYSSLAVPSNKFPQDSIDYQQIPNEALQPEVLGSLEIGARYQMNAKLSLEAIFFAHRTSNKIARYLIEIDRNIYPKSVQFNSILAADVPVARTFANYEESTASLMSLQILLKGRDLLPKLKLNINASLTYNSGEESIIANEEGNIFDIDEHRTIPNFIGQFNVDMKPHQNWYFRFENVLMSGWTNRFFYPTEFLPGFNNQTKGYYTLDALIRYDLSQRLSIYGKVVNVFNADYGGIGATGFDIDLPYNPQYLRTFQFGLNFSL